MSGILAGLITMVGFGIVNSVSKFPISKIGPIRSIFWRTLFEFLMITVIVLLVYPHEIRAYAAQDIRIMIGIALLGYIPFLSFQYALQKGEIGIVSPVGNSSLLFAAPFAYFILGETVSPVGIMGIIVLFFGILLLTMNFSSISSSKLFSLKHGVPYAVIAALGRGLVFTLFSISSRSIGPVMTTFLLMAVNLVASITMMVLKKEPFQRPGRHSLSILVLISFCSMAAMFAYNSGVAVSSTYLVAALGFSSPLVAILIGYVFFSERLSVQQWGGVFVMLMGMFLITSF